MIISALNRPIRHTLDVLLGLNYSTMMDRFRTEPNYASYQLEWEYVINSVAQQQKRSEERHQSSINHDKAVPSSLYIIGISETTETFNSEIYYQGTS